MKTTISDSETFVRNTMNALPQRKSILVRIGQSCLAFILSPLWMWTCVLLLVVLFHRPLLLLLLSLTSSPTLNMGILILSLSTLVFTLSVQMIRDLHL